MTNFSMRSALSLLLAGSISSAFAQVKPLTEEHYFRNNFKGITSPLPKVLNWTSGSTFTMMKGDKTYTVDAKTGKETEAGKVDVPMKQNPVFIKDNDIFLRKDGKEIRLTNDKTIEKNPTLSPDGRFVAYTKDNDLYTAEVSTTNVNRLTNDGSDVVLNGYASWVYMEEILGRSSNYRAFWWSPDSKSIAFFRSDDTEVPVFTITDANDQHGYVETVRYPKVGDKNPEVRIGIVNPAGGKITWADFNASDDQYFGAPIWKPQGDALLVQWLNRKQNLLKIWSVDPATGSKKPFYTEEQKTWVDLEGDRITFLDNNKGLLLQSDASGWNHLYLHDMEGNLVNQVTTGNFTVTDINHVDTKNNIVYFTARKENSARRDLYSVTLKGKDMKRLTFGDYSHSVNLSPDASYFVTTYSNVSTPAAMALVSNKGKVIRELGSAKGEEFDQYKLAKVEMIRVKSDDGKYDLPMKVTWPVDMVQGKKYPVLISIYGGPNSTGVNDVYSINGTQQFWAKEGLIQVSMDHRGSGHFGKVGAAELYHNLGYWEMKDYSTMVNWLIKNGSADPSKIAITGFSYGGFVSAYALTYGADVFTHGMAGGSVTDWSLYDTHYTERYMGTLKDNPEGYKNSNVMNHVDKYKGKLQIVHGIIDENVHMQNSIKLISALQDKKKDFEMMIYSGGRHGWGGAKGLHFQNLKTKFIYEHLLEKEVPQGFLK